MKEKFTRLVSTIFLSFLLAATCSGAGNDQEIAHLYNGLLVGEIQPNGKVYLERLALDGGFDNMQQFAGSTYPDKLKIFPLVGSGALQPGVQYLASRKTIIRKKYIASLATGSHYFSHPYSTPGQDALLYVTSYQPAQPVLVIAHENDAIESVLLFTENEKREYTEQEQKDALKQVAADNKFKKENGSTLAAIKPENTILGARKVAQLKLMGAGYTVLLSRYRTWGMEYVSEVYVTDFLVNGKVVKSFLKNNVDGPY